jgi:hypothetical protein
MNHSPGPWNWGYYDDQDLIEQTGCEHRVRVAIGGGNDRCAKCGKRLGDTDAWKAAIGSLWDTQMEGQIK